MSETDSFIHEVTEEVRHDRMFRLWKKYGPYGIAAVAVVIVASAGLTWMKHREVQQARELGGAMLAAEIGDAGELETLVGRLDGAPEAIAKMRLAATKAGEGDTEAAAALYREVAGMPGLDPAYADLARLQAVRVQMAAMDPAAALSELDRLAADDAPYRLLALELRAALRLNSGDTEAAHADLNAIITDPGATRGLRERATVMLISSGGTPPAVATQ